MYIYTYIYIIYYMHTHAHTQTHTHTRKSTCWQELIDSHIYYEALAEAEVVRVNKIINDMFKEFKGFIL